MESFSTINLETLSSSLSPLSSSKPFITKHRWQPKYSSPHISKLPSFTLDGGDYIFSSMIERSFDSFGPHVTTFFLSHFALVPYNSARYGVVVVNPDSITQWKQISDISRQREASNEIIYEMSGKRVSRYDYFCKISNRINETSYMVKGYFLPNRLSTDFYSNKRLDIFRCPLLDGKNISQVYKNTNEEIQVEIIWNHMKLIEFTIPWKTRRTGYILHSPAMASQIDAWSSPSPPYRSGQRWNPVIHLSMPLTRLQASRNHLALMLEYISHHILMGFHHIYFTIAYSWESKDMKLLLQLLRSYIEEGKVTISSCTTKEINYQPSANGILWNSVTMKIFSSSMALFYAKGFADYLAVFDVDEFFTPKSNFNSIQDIIRVNDMPSIENHVVPGKGIKGSKGFADKHQHPLCFLQILSEVVGNTKKNEILQPWIGLRFSHSQEYVKHGAVYDPYGPKPLPYTYSKAIYPTRVIYQVGVGVGSACRLDWKWTSCGNSNDSKTETETETEFCEKGYGIPDQLCDYHRFDEVVGLKKRKTIDPWNQAVILHFLLYNPLEPSEKAMKGKNIYTSFYYSNVMKDLKSRGLDFLLHLSYSQKESYRFTIPKDWEPFLID